MLNMADNSSSDDTNSSREQLAERSANFRENAERKESEAAVKKSEKSDFSEQVKNGEVTMEDVGSGYVPRSVKSKIREMQQAEAEAKESDE